MHIVSTFSCPCMEMPFKSCELLRCLFLSDTTFEVPFVRAAEDSGEIISRCHSQEQGITDLVWYSVILFLHGK